METATQETGTCAAPRPLLMLSASDKGALLESLQQLETPAGSAQRLPHPAPWVLKLLRSSIGASPSTLCAESSESSDNVALCVDITWDFLHSGPWKDIAPYWRTMHSCACLLLATRKYNAGNTKGAHRMLDMAAIMGGPVHEQVIEHLFKAMSVNVSPEKRKLSSLPEPSTGAQPKRDRPNIDKAKEVPSMPPPTLPIFLRDIMGEGSPWILRGGCTHWPAFARWKDLRYLSQLAGHRTVPVEIGRSYTSADWGQTLMTFDQFLSDYILKDHASAAQVHSVCGDGPPSRKIRSTLRSGGTGNDSTSAACTHAESQQLPRPSTSSASGSPTPITQECSSSNDGGGSKTGYLAQHPLFDQIPELRRDIMTPDYCALTLPGSCEKQLNDEVLVNAWFGPAGTVSTCHYDPYHNLLAQVKGSKYIRLYAPSETPRLFPRPAPLSNTSQVDVEAPDLSKFPDFAKATYVECILDPGDMLYIPPRYWHYVRSLEISLSVSFWWT